MRRIYSGWRVYNANSQNRSTEDCVKRALTVAYGLDYNDVANELNAIKRKQRREFFNVKPVYTAFIRSHGVVSIDDWAAFGYTNKKPTVAQFCEDHPEGTFILVVGHAKRRGTHMVTIIDGDFWDSWDCSEWEAFELYCVKEGKSEPKEELSKEAIRDSILDFVGAYLEQIKKKMPYCEFSYGIARHVADGWKFSIQAHTDKETRHSCVFHFIAKMNPRLSETDNIDKLIAKCRVAIREWAYALRKDIEDREALKEVQLHPKFRAYDDADRMLLMKIPSWARPLVKEAHDYRNDGEWARDWGIRLELEALPDDPRAEEAPTVHFEADTFAALRHDLEDYKSKFYRLNYDY